MKQATNTPPRGYTTGQVADALGVVPHTIRVSCCEKGEYMGIKPVKLPNRRLLWPADAVDAVARGQAPTYQAA